MQKKKIQVKSLLKKKKKKNLDKRTPENYIDVKFLSLLLFHQDFWEICCNLDSKDLCTPYTLSAPTMVEPKDYASS